MASKRSISSLTSRSSAPSSLSAVAIAAPPPKEATAPINPLRRLPAGGLMFAESSWMAAAGRVTET